MKIKFHYIIIALLLAATGCKKDNYDAPSVKLSGHLVYQGEHVNVEFNRVPFQLYQPGFGLSGPINGTFDQDGGYSVLTFAGNYKFTMSANQGPFLWKEVSAGKRDTLAINLTGDQTLDIEVTPFYMVRQPVFAKSGSNLTATFNLQKVVTDANAKNVQFVALYVNKTQFVSGDNDQNIAKKEVNGGDLTSMNGINLSVAIPTISPTQNYVFGRIGVKIEGVEDMIFSPVTKVTF